MVYRAGWNLSLAGIAATATAGALLLPAGVLLDREMLSLVNVVGVFVCILGIVMVNWKK